MTAMAVAGPSLHTRRLAAFARMLRPECRPDSPRRIFKLLPLVRGNTTNLCSATGASSTTPQYYELETPSASVPPLLDQVEFDRQRYMQLRSREIKLGRPTLSK